ncbi:MAG: hypothetical protein AB7U35_11640 [Sphingobium sp.]
MSNSSIWGVDRVAAGNLAASLGLQLSEQDAERVAAHFARHRTGSYEWVARRVQANIIQMLEAASARLFDRNRAEWSDGFRNAEMVIHTAAPDELLGIESSEARSKGQVLRTMVRRAKAEIRSH